ncbi:MAG: hypothetical protein V5A25_11060, partial [Halovenus sp.]
MSSVPDAFRNSQGEARTGADYALLGGTQDAKDVVEHDDTPDDIKWSDVQSWIETFEEWYTWGSRQALWLAGIDAVGFEVSFGVEVTVGAVGVNVDPIGVTFLWITNADVDPSEQQGADKDPIAGNPHTYAFSAISVGGGPGAKVAGDFSVDVFRADRWGEHNLPSSWTGPAVSVDIEGSLGKYAGGQFSASKFASIDMSSEYAAYGIPFDPSDAWTGTSFSLGLEGGAGGELQIGVSLIGASESVTAHMETVQSWLGSGQDKEELEKQIEKAPKS